MRTFDASIDIAASPEALFDLSQSYDHRLDWDPFLCEARLVDGATAPGVGVRAWCVSRRPRLGMETEYVSFDRPRVTAVKMTRGPWFLRAFAGSWRFELLGDGQTRVTFRYSLATRPALLRPIVTAVFNREMHGRLAAFKAAVEGGVLAAKVRA